MFIIYYTYITHILLFYTIFAQDPPLLDTSRLPLLMDPRTSHLRPPINLSSVDCFEEICRIYWLTTDIHRNQLKQHHLLYLPSPLLILHLLHHILHLSSTSTSPPPTPPPHHPPTPPPPPPHPPPHPLHYTTTYTTTNNNNTTCFTTL